MCASLSWFIQRGGEGRRMACCVQRGAPRPGAQGATMPPAPVGLGGGMAG